MDFTVPCDECKTEIAMEEDFRKVQKHLNKVSGWDAEQEQSKYSATVIAEKLDPDFTHTMADVMLKTLPWPKG